MSEVAKVFALLMSLMVTGLAGYAGVTAINAIQRRHRQADPGLEPGELDEIRAQVADLDHLRGRVAELEERLDFTERLLAQQQEPPQLGGGA